MSTFLKQIDAVSTEPFIGNSTFCEVLLMFAVLDLHANLFAGPTPTHTDQWILTAPPFGNKKNEKRVIRADLMVVAGQSWGIAGEVIGGKEQGNGGTNHFSESHDNVMRIVGDIAPMAGYLAQKIMCQLFPARLKIRDMGVEPDRSFAYFAAARNHAPFLNIALDRLYETGLTADRSDSLSPETFPLTVYRITFADMDTVLAQLGGSPEQQS